MTVLAAHIEEAVHDHVGAVIAERPGHALDDAVPAPAVDGLVRILGETEIMHGIVVALAAKGQRRVERARRFGHFAGAQHTENRAAFGADSVLSAFATGAAIANRAHAIDVPQGGTHAAGPLVDRERGVSGKSGSVRVDLVGLSI